MTEEEAKTKWCPQARASQGVGANGFNRINDGLPSKDAFCIASDCMMWTWDKNQIVGEFRPEHNGKPENRSGYCGLINT